MGDLNLWIITIVMGLVEGLTEFIPVSSTGHLIIAGWLLKFSEALGGEDKEDIFVVCIQLGAILAVGIIYRQKLINAFLAPLRWFIKYRKGKGNSSEEQGMLESIFAEEGNRLLLKLILGTVPAALVGFLVHDLITDYLFSPVTVAIALIVGGLIILFIESRKIEPSARDTGEITYGQALTVGLVQILSLIPGTSRSGATIMGGLCAKLDRRTATEFSFLLSFPIMTMATIYSLVKGYHLLEVQYIAVLVAGFVVSFISAYIVVVWLIRFVQRHSFNGFAYYRIGVGILILILWYAVFGK